MQLNMAYMAELASYKAEGMTQQEIAEIFGVTQQRVNQLLRYYQFSNYLIQTTGAVTITERRFRAYSSTLAPSKSTQGGIPKDPESAELRGQRNAEAAERLAVYQAEGKTQKDIAEILNVTQQRVNQLLTYYRFSNYAMKTTGAVYLDERDFRRYWQALPRPKSIKGALPKDPKRAAAVHAERDAHRQEQEESVFAQILKQEASEREQQEAL
jgi:predicted XRE-type DNA-binding protein